MSEPKKIETCPTCGSSCAIEGDNKEGTHYYVPVKSKLKFSDREEMLSSLDPAPYGYVTSEGCVVDEETSAAIHDLGAERMYDALRKHFGVSEAGEMGEAKECRFHQAEKNFPYYCPTGERCGSRPCTVRREE